MPILVLARIVLDPDLAALALRLFAKINYACSVTVPVLRMAICCRHRHKSHNCVKRNQCYGYGYAYGYAYAYAHAHAHAHAHGHCYAMAMPWPCHGHAMAMPWQWLGSLYALLDYCRLV